MSQTENGSNTPTSPQSSSTSMAAVSVKELQANYEGLRVLLNMVLIGSIILHLSLAIFIFRELRVVRRQIEENSRAVANYHNVIAPKINELQLKLTDYSRQHPSFAPVVRKYFSTNSPNPTPAAAPNPAGAPLPVPAPALRR